MDLSSANHQKPELERFIPNPLPWSPHMRDLFFFVSALGIHTIVGGAHMCTFVVPQALLIFPTPTCGSYHFTILYTVPCRGQHLLHTRYTRIESHTVPFYKKCIYSAHAEFNLGWCVGFKKCGLYPGGWGRRYPRP